MVGKEILDLPSAGCLNLHGSLLPRYRGRCPVNWVLAKGEKETGVTLHYMTLRPDDGDIIGQREVAIDEDDTALSLHTKLAGISRELLDNLLPRILENRAERRPQDNSMASYFGGRQSKDGEIDWQQGAESVRNLIRAVTQPYPGAFSFLGNRKVLFWKVNSVASFDTQAPEPGTVISISPSP